VGGLERSVRYFEHNYKHRKIQQLLLVGNGAKLHGLLKHLRAPERRSNVAPDRPLTGASLERVCDAL
jgi:Tfp pilus assembly PilM family ATPase